MAGVLSMKTGAMGWVDRFRTSKRQRQFEEAEQQLLAQGREADMSLNSAQAFATRQKIQRDRRVVAALDSWWQSALCLARCARPGNVHQPPPARGCDLCLAGVAS